MPRVTVVQDEYLERELQPFGAEATDAALGAASRVLAPWKRNALAHHWSVVLMTGCPQEANGNVFVEGRAVARDNQGHVRAYIESSGNGDSAAVWRLYYDERARLRLVTVTSASVNGEAVSGAMLLAVDGHVDHCATVPADAAKLYCHTTHPNHSSIDPTVADAVKPELLQRDARHQAFSPPLVHAMALDPITEFNKCTTPYR